MKVIDLLNKIANGEIPEKIKFIGKIWEYDDSVNDYSYFLIDHYEYFFNNISFSYINDKVEIIEDTPKEDKKIERLDETKANEDIFTYSTSGSNLYFLSLYVKSTIVDKINEIIDKVNGDSDE